MSDKQEHWYVVSESEYRQALYTCLMRAEAMRTESPLSSIFKHCQEEFEKAEAACRARPVEYQGAELHVDDEGNKYFYKVYRELRSTDEHNN